MIGARVIKTSLAVILSILTARGLELHTPQFAGIIAVLAVQPSMYRSFRYGMQLTISAIMGALCGAYALYFIGNSFLIMGIVTFLLMTIHVKIRWTNSLLASVVIAINTLGSASLFFGDSALNQMELVLIGTGFGLLVNIFHKPVHQDRAETLLTQSEGMLRALLYYIYIELMQNRVIHYPVMREQINEVREYIERGKEVSLLVKEDQKFRALPDKNLLQFQTFESMAERIRDMTKELQKIDAALEESDIVKKVIRLIIVMQERVIQGKAARLPLFRDVLERRREAMWDAPQTSQGFAVKLGYYNFYGYATEYLWQLGAIQNQANLFSSHSEPIRDASLNAASP